MQKRVRGQRQRGNYWAHSPQGIRIYWSGHGLNFRKDLLGEEPEALFCLVPWHPAVEHMNHTFSRLMVHCSARIFSMISSGVPMGWVARRAAKLASAVPPSALWRLRYSS